MTFYPFIVYQMIKSQIYSVTLEQSSWSLKKRDSIFPSLISFITVLNKSIPLSVVEELGNKSLQKVKNY